MWGDGHAGTVPGDGMGRTLLAMGDDPELAVALRDRLDRAYVTVREVRHGETDAALRGCRPFPWMVVGTGSDVAPDALARLRQCPTLVLWRGPAPPGLPAHARSPRLFSTLAVAIEAALDAEVAGMRLAPGAGLTMPDGGHATNGALEAIVAAHPRPLFAPAQLFRLIPSLLEEHRVGARLARDAGGGARLLIEER